MELLRAVPILTVADPAAAARDYRGALGLDILMDLGWIVTLGSSVGTWPLPQFSVMSRDRTAPMNPCASLEVPDVDAAYRGVLAQRLEIVHELTDEDWGVRRFFFRDGGGNVLNVLSHRG